MSKEALSRQRGAEPHVLVVNTDVQSRDLMVREAPCDAPAFNGVSDQISTKTTDWPAENNRCPCRPRRLAEEELTKKIEELGRSNQELEQFASVAAHDLQEPLRMVVAYTQLLGDKYRGRLDADADQYIEYVREGATRLQALIRDLLSYSRVGRSDAERRVVDSRLALVGALKSLEGSVSESETTVRASRLPLVLANQSQLLQVFQNLVGNAIKFRRDEAPRVSIDAVRDGDFWRFSVSDNGIGIAPEHVEGVFAIFHRLHTREEYPGNGIGLAICKRIVERFGGRIWLEPRVGQGTTFHFTLPAVDREERGEPGEPTRTAGPSRR